MVEMGHFGASVGVRLSADLFKLFDDAGAHPRGPAVMATLDRDLGRDTSAAINAEGSESAVLALATRRLRAMKFFSILERYDESVELLAHTFCWNAAGFVSRNACEDDERAAASNASDVTRDRRLLRAMRRSRSTRRDHRRALRADSARDRGAERSAHAHRKPAFDEDKDDALARRSRGRPPKPTCNLTAHNMRRAARAEARTAAFVGRTHPRLKLDGELYAAANSLFDARLRRMRADQRLGIACRYQAGYPAAAPESAACEMVCRL
jgi:hypothetical protein